MKWFDFSNIPFVIFLVLVTIALSFLTFLIISLILSSRKDYKYIERMKTESTTIRVFVIDVKKNSVVYFNRSDLRNKRQIDLNSFYSNFHTNDVDKIKN